jgi:hypothetical protein
MRIVRAFVIGSMLILLSCSDFANEREVRAASLAAHALKIEIVGTWRLDSRAVRQPDGTETFAASYGPNPVGYLTYDNTGHMSIQQMRPNRPKKDTTDGYEAYFGTYSIDEQKGTVTHHIEGDLLTERVGKDFTRDVAIKGDELLLTVHEPLSTSNKEATIVKHYTRFRAKN